MRRPGKATAHAAWNLAMSLLMSLSRMNRARSFTVPSCLCFIPPCAAPQSLLHSPSPFDADESTGPRLISAQTLFPSSHTRLHVRNLILARAHVGENRLPLEAANVLGVRVVVSVEVGHHVLEFGWIMLAELAEDEEAAQVQRVAGFVGGLVPPGVEAEAFIHSLPLRPTRVHGVGEAHVPERGLGGELLGTTPPFG